MRCSKFVVPPFVALATVIVGISCSSEGTGEGEAVARPKNVSETAKPIPPTLTSITYDSPYNNKFKWNVENIFWVNGTSLTGATLDNLTGTIGTAKDPVTWTPFSVVSN